MLIKRGSLVSHGGALQWGVGKVVELAELKATIQFSDGVIRKIASSHYSSLQAGDPTAFVPVPESVAVVKVRAVRKKKVVLAAADPLLDAAPPAKVRATRAKKLISAAVC